MILWADIRQVKAGIHRVLAPLHIARRSHMATVVARMAVVGKARLTAFQRRINVEVVRSLHRAARLLLRQFVGHPVRNEPALIIGDTEALVLQHPLATARHFQTRQFQ